jgi:hypothetical protein
MRRKLALLGSVLCLAVLAFAAATPLTVVNLKLNNYAVQAGDLTLPFTACDASAGNSYVMAGTEILLVQNTDASPHTFTVTSTPDNYGRLDTSLTGYSVAANIIAAIQMEQSQGRVGAGNAVNLTCSSALLKFAVLRYPQ